jgi:hypothetical protein
MLSSTGLKINTQNKHADPRRQPRPGGKFYGDRGLRTLNRRGALLNPMRLPVRFTSQPSPKSGKVISVVNSNTLNIGACKHKIQP